MSGARHTPGDWTYRTAANGDCGITAPGCSVLAETYADIRFADEGSRAEAEANARLIAAAPDLLEALEPMLKHAIERCSDAPEWTPRDAVTCIFTIEELQNARAAIAKARGQS